ncbi:hypothetical protein MSAN_01526100 [Mycena sanguinolenta]|uniref:Pali-domain-containing protein n=1 Tax=Mycena sanguinolenta TaxID=230812 RepID=A0A8H6Y867_9AGAR|nr:hypothetical protein MSAN_01526100 [Mycena sanguinolenta]
MARAFYLSGMGFLFCALVLSFLSSISLPYLPALDFTRVTFTGVFFPGSAADELSQLRVSTLDFFCYFLFTLPSHLAVGGFCEYDGNNHRHCFHTGHGYPIEIETPEEQTVIIGASWTRGLAIHPVATGVVAIAFGFAASKSDKGPLLIAFAIDIALFAFVHHEIGKLKNVDAAVHAGSAFWMTLVSLILVLLAGCTVCFGRRKEAGSDAYPMFTKTASGGGFLSRFRR